MEKVSGLIAFVGLLGLTVLVWGFVIQMGVDLKGRILVYFAAAWGLLTAALYIFFLFRQIVFIWIAAASYDVFSKITGRSAYASEPSVLQMIDDGQAIYWKFSLFIALIVAVGFLIRYFVPHDPLKEVLDDFKRTGSEAKKEPEGSGTL